MLTPPRALPAGGTIAVLAASSSSERERIESAAQPIEQRGYRVILAPNIDHRFGGYLAGDDDERAAELNHYLRSGADAIFFARGGYGAMRILDRLDYDAYAANPRPVVGFSDVTALHQAIATRCGVVGIHGPMLNLDFHDGLSPEIEEWFWSMLSGAAPMTHRFTPAQVLSEGEAEGVLFGGCLSLTAALIGTPYDFWIDDGIWFFEDVDEPLYRIDRMLTHLRLSGRLQKIRGVLIGKMRGCGSDAELGALVRHFFPASGTPVIRDLPFGHHGNNLAMPIGVPVRLSTRDCTFTMTRAAVAP